MTAKTTPHGRITAPRAGEAISSRRHLQPLANAANADIDRLRGPQQLGAPEQAAPSTEEADVTQVVTSPDGLVLIATGATFSTERVYNEDESAYVDVDRFATVQGTMSDGRPFLIDLRNVL